MYDHTFYSLASQGFDSLAYLSRPYSAIQMAFQIAQLNRQHWLRHGLPADRFSYVRYCTPDRARLLTLDDRELRRRRLRQSIGVNLDQLFVAIFGKLIPRITQPA